MPSKICHVIERRKRASFLLSDTALKVKSQTSQNKSAYCSLQAGATKWHLDYGHAEVSVVSIRR